MARFVMVAQSAALPGREAEYAAWYDRYHVREICAMPGVLSGQRYEAALMAVGEPGLANIGIYELEVESAEAFAALIGQYSAAGKFTQTDAMDRSRVSMWFYRKPDQPAEG